MVLEHVSQPWDVLFEMRRVLRPTGAAIIHTTNVQSPLFVLGRAIPRALRGWLASRLEGRCPCDVFPTLYRANTPATLCKLAGQVRFSIDLACVTTGLLFKRIPILRNIECAIQNYLAAPGLEHWRPVMIAVLRPMLEVQAVPSVGPVAPVSSADRRPTLQAS
jgi:hypothetical protein